MIDIMDAEQLQEFIQQNYLNDYNLIRLTYVGGHQFWTGQDFDLTIQRKFTRDSVAFQYTNAVAYLRRGLRDAEAGKLEIISSSVRFDVDKLQCIILNHPQAIFNIGARINDEQRIFWGQFNAFQPIESALDLTAQQVQADYYQAGQRFPIDLSLCLLIDKDQWVCPD